MKKISTLFVLFLGLGIADEQEKWSKIFSSAKENTVYFVSDDKDNSVSLNIYEEKDSIIRDQQEASVSSDSIPSNKLPVQEDCPKLKRRSVLCDAIHMRMDDTDPDSNYDYWFERVMESIVCADPAKESREEINKKIHDVFVRYGDELYCDSLSFNVPKGNFFENGCYKFFRRFFKSCGKRLVRPVKQN